MKVSSGLSSSCFSPSTCGNKCWLCSQMSLCHEWGPQERERKGPNGEKRQERRGIGLSSCFLTPPSLPRVCTWQRGNRPAPPKIVTHIRVRTYILRRPR